MKQEFSGHSGRARAPHFAESQDPKTNTVAKYLNSRLAQIGVSHVFAIPGDYVAEWVNTLDQEGQNPGGLIRVHPNNEVSAVYAADGQARAVAGSVGCAAFTYGVGALNAVQALAGAYVERVPVVMINGSPSTAQFNSDRDQGVLYHHMIGGHHTDRRIYSEVTEMAARIDNPATAPAVIDTVLTACLTSSRPVYLELPVDIALLPCIAAPATPLTAQTIVQDETALKEALDAVLAHMRKAKRLVVMAGAEIARSNLSEKLTRFLRVADAPYCTSPTGKSVLAEDRADISFGGVYFGKSSQDNVQELVKSADCIVSLGVADTDFNYLGIVTPDYSPSSDPLPGPTHIQARSGAVLVGRKLAYWGNVQLESLLDELIDALEKQPLPGTPFPGLEGKPWDCTPPEKFPEDDPVTYDSLKAHLGTWADSCEIYPQFIADAGFSFLAFSNLKAAERGYVAQLAWAAIGYGTGAMSGVALAQDRRKTRRRTVCIAGDAAFAETCNSLGMVAQLGLDCIIFVIDNKVYAVEQWLIDARAFSDKADAPPFEPLTEVPQGHIWNYVQLAEAFGGVGYRARNNAELKKVMASLNEAPVNESTGKPTFTLVALEVPGTDLPDISRWKIER